MDVGMIGLGRMGLNMGTRLTRAGHRVVGTDSAPEAVRHAGEQGLSPAESVEALVARLAPPRAVWLMVPVGAPVEELVAALTPQLARGDILVDGGNSYYRDSARRAQALAPRGIAFVDCGTSGGVWGLENGYCLMVGGEAEPVGRLRPLLDALAPPRGWKHVGGPGAGHFVKMVHNAIEYGMLEAYAEGFEILHASEYGIDLPAVAALWNQGGVVRSWLLELLVLAFEKDPGLADVAGYVEDSGMGRWTVQECVDRAIPAPVIALSLMARFRSRQSDSFGARVIASLRNEFGGHPVHKAEA